MRENTNTDEINGEPNKSIADTNDSKDNLLVTKSDFLFSIFSISMPFLCYFSSYNLCEFFGFSGYPSDSNSCLATFLVCNITIELIYISLYKTLKNNNKLNKNIFTINTIILILIAFLPAFGLLYAFGGFLFILPVICYWFIYAIQLIKFIYSTSRLFRLCIFGILIYLTIVILYMIKS